MKNRILLISALLLSSITGQAALSFLASPDIQNLQPTEATIVWTSTGTTDVHGWVEYGTTATDIQEFEVDNGLITAYINIYRITLKNLQPGTTYKYKVICRNILAWPRNSEMAFGSSIESKEYTFTTPTGTETSAKFLVYSGVKSSTDFYTSILTKNSLNVNDFNGVIFGGNCINGANSVATINSDILVPMGTMLGGKIPFYMARGYRECRANSSRILKNYFYTPGTPDLHTFYYTFTVGPCMFIVLDPGDDNSEGDALYKELNTNSNTEYMTTQASWLSQVIASDSYKAAKYHVVIEHQAQAQLDAVLKTISPDAVIKGDGSSLLTTVEANATNIVVKSYK